MVDLSSSTSLAASLSNLASSSSGTLTTVTTAIASLPQNYENLSYTIQTNATPQTINGNTLTLTTASGTITVSLPQLGAAIEQNLQQQLMNLIDIQKPLTLAVQAGSPPTQAVLLLPTQPAGTATVSTSTSTSLAVNNLAPLPVLPPVTSGMVLSAVVLPPDLSAQTPVALDHTAIPYNQTTASTAPSAIPQETTVSLAAAPTLTFVAPSTSQPNQTTAPLIPLLQAGAQVDLRVVSNTTPPLTATSGVPTEVPKNTVTPPANNMSPASSPPTTPAAASAPPDINTGSNTVKATVTAAMPDGKTLLQTDAGTLYIKTPTSMPVGTTLIVTVQAAKTTAPLPLPAPASPTVALPTLPQAMAALAQLSPPLFQQTLAALPQPNTALAGTLLLLFGAFKKGDVQSWLGNESAHALITNGKGDLIASLSRELSSAEQSSHDTVVGEWRSYPIPLYAQEQFKALTLYVHRDKDSSTPDKPTSKNDKVRFVIDFRLSHLGAMQLDGFVQPQKLDMCLRSENHLPEGLHQHLRNAYINAVSAVGFAGSLNFQVGRQAWVQMNQAAPQGIVT